MIPSHKQAVCLWDTYHLPLYKRIHCALVAQVALRLADGLEKKGIWVNVPLLEAAALLHDIDKAAKKRFNEHHPDTGVRILRQEGYDEVAEVVRTHPLHAILDQTISPKTWEERILFLADKMVKYAIITVDERFALWRKERLPREAKDILTRAYPKVKALEREVCNTLGVATLSEMSTIQS